LGDKLLVDICGWGGGGWNSSILVPKRGFVHVPRWRERKESSKVDSTLSREPFYTQAACKSDADTNVVDLVLSETLKLPDYNAGRTLCWKIPLRQKAY
jgi:hypothetical protein